MISDGVKNVESAVAFRQHSELRQHFPRPRMHGKHNGKPFRKPVQVLHDFGQAGLVIDI